MSTPSGTVNLNKNGFSIGSATVQPDGTFTLSYTTDGSDIPLDNITATYIPDGTHNTSSGSCAVEVDSGIQNTVTTITANSPVLVGQQVTITGSVTNA